MVAVVVIIVVCFCIVIFFFKQKTAYEMRISDWSSDVCSSDLRVPGINIKRTTMAHEESKLFSPLKIGEKTVKNRMVVAPMRRHRAALSGVPTELNVEYYRQRASAGLIVTEGNAPSAMSRGDLFTQGHSEHALVQEIGTAPGREHKRRD